MARYSAERVGVYVDVENLSRSGGYGMRYDVLQQFAVRDGAEPVRLNAYVAVEPDPARQPPTYQQKLGFHATLRNWGYKVIEKPAKWYRDEQGNEYSKANADLDMAVDALLQSEKLDRVVMATGDGDFVQVVRALQNKGCRVEVVAFENVARELQREADMFMSGFVIPNLLPIRADRTQGIWGEMGSRVRGVCYHPLFEERSHGYLRFARAIAPSVHWPTDTRQADSPYVSVNAQQREFPRDFSDFSAIEIRRWILEFTVDAVQGSADKLIARDIVSVWKY